MKKDSGSTLLARKIRDYLKRTEKSVTQFARELGVSRVTIYNLGKGIHGHKLLRRVSDAISVPVHVLLMPDTPTDTPAGEEILHAYHSAPPRVQRAVNLLLQVGPSARISAKPVVIVVDDVLENVEFLKRCLRKDFEVLEFTDPATALQTVTEREVAAIVTDERMPTMTGTELLTKINALGKPIAKLIVSAYSDNEALQNAINKAGVDAFFLKPLAPQDLRHRLHELLHSHPHQGEEAN